MSVVHIFRQGPMLATLARTVASSVASSVGLGGNKSDFGPSANVYEARVAPRHPDLVRDYLQHVGGDPNLYKGQLPPHLFPQWGMPLMQRTIARLPYNLVRIVNAGCEYSVLGKLPDDTPLVLKAVLENVDDNGRRALITIRLQTGTEEQPELLISRVTAMVPLKTVEDRKTGSGGPPKEPLRIPENGREISRTRLPGDAGFEYACVTGDFNPVHWVLPYARLAGYRGKILHGFSAVARVVEDLGRHFGPGRTDVVEKIEIRFLKPVVLPTDIGTYIDGEGGVYVGDAPGGLAAFSGHYSLTKETRNG